MCESRQSTLGGVGVRLCQVTVDSTLRFNGFDGYSFAATCYRLLGVPNKYARVDRRIVRCRGYGGHGHIMGHDQRKRYWGG